MNELHPEVRFPIYINPGGRIWGAVIDPATPPFQQDVRFSRRTKREQEDYINVWYECVTCVAHLGFEFFKTSEVMFPEAEETDHEMRRARHDMLLRQMVAHAENHAKLAHVALSILRSQGYTMRKQ